TQYWGASYLIPPETWAIFRRSGYPVLSPNPRQDDLGGDENFMRRLGYPDDERSVNPNVSNGTTPDRIDTRVWWDTE
ncbi:MAG: SusD/RagB family nutrient-binding outer membrane lipoprotein, partial [Balneolaceae bacterium]